MTLHPYVLFVGDRPASDNLNIYVPFVGSKSYKRLLEWLYEMDVDITRVGMVNSVHARRADLKVSDRVVALGKIAGEYVKEIRPDAFVLPHPSGRNRLINDKKKLAGVLEECRQYIYGRSR